MFDVERVQWEGFEVEFDCEGLIVDQCLFEECCRQEEEQCQCEVEWVVEEFLIVQIKFFVVVYVDGLCGSVSGVVVVEFIVVVGVGGLVFLGNEVFLQSV